MRGSRTSPTPKRRERSSGMELDLRRKMNREQLGAPVRTQPLEGRIEIVRTRIPHANRGAGVAGH